MPHKVSHPLKMSDNGVEVVNLQDALQLLIDKNKLLIEDPAAKERLLRALASERTRQVFGDNGTLRLVQLFQTQQQLRSTGEVDEITADMINKLLKELGAIEVPTEIQFSVRGQVHSADGRVTNRVLVRAFDKDLRSEQLLGETNTDANGQYEITYTSEQFRRADKGTADLRVAALDERGREIVSSGVIFNAQPIETVDLVAGEEVSALSEYERLLQELVPLLEDVPLRELNADDVNFLANDTQIDSTLIRQLSDSARLAQESKDRGEAHAISAEVFYGLLRQNLPSDLSALLSHNRELLRRALLTSIDTSIVPAKLRDELDRILENFPALQSLVLLEPRKGGGLRPIFDAMREPLPADKQETFVALFAKHQSAGADFWKDVEKAGFTATEVKDVQTSLKLAVLTRNHVPLIKELQNLQDSDIRNLARLNGTEWVELAKRHGVPEATPGATEKEQLQNYADQLAQSIELSYPTAVIAARVQNGTFTVEGEAREDLSTFFNTNAGFEFGQQPVTTFLESGSADLSGVADRDRLRTELQKIERVTKITSRPTEANVLLEAGLDSGSKIVHLGKEPFNEIIGDKVGGPNRAGEIFTKAEQQTALALALFSKYSQRVNSIDLRVMPRQATEEMETSTETAEPPDLRTLFGALDMCDCEQCKSVYSPAAYLVDVLKFLEDRPQKLPLQVLLGRRPDLAEIALTCENTQTPLPYVDLVNEVLEEAVALRVFEITLPSNSNIVAQLNSKIVTPGLTAEFKNQGLPISDAAIVRIEKASERWSVFDPGWKFSLSFQSGKITVRPWPQTSWQPAELKANPEHLSDKAYDKLQASVYPWQLPFNLWIEEARIYLNHLGLERADLMETLFKGSLDDARKNRAIAGEFLQITPAEADLIDGTTSGDPNVPQASRGPWNFWGFSQATLSATNSIPDPFDRSRKIESGNWSTVLTDRVDVFLQQSGLAFRELQELLGTFFINPGRTIEIEFGTIGPQNTLTCDLSKAKIKGLGNQAEQTLEKIHRFVCLGRKLGWTIRELDQVVTDAPKNQGNLDLSQFLIRVSSIQRLRQLLNLPVTTISNWWSTTSRIHTAHYVDYLADEQPNIPSPYDELFQNKSVTKPVDEAFALNSTRDELQNPSPLANPITISSHGPTVTAALAISARELSLLLGAEVQDKLNLTNLWELYRRTSLAKALDLSVSDFISAKAFVGSDPLGSPAATLRFVESINAIRSSRFSLAEIDYLVRHQFSPSESIAPTDESIAFVLDEIRAGLQKIAAENSFTSNTNDPEGNLTRRKLAVVLPESQVATAMTLLDGSWKDDSVSSQTEKRTFVDTYFAKFLDTADARAKLIGSGSLTSGEQRFLYILQNLLSYLRTSLSESFVSQKLAEALKLETEVSENLLRRWITSPATTGQACMADFLDPVFALSDTTIKVTPAAFHRQFKTYTRLHKVALIIGKLEMTARQLHWLFDYGIPAQFLDLNRMPTPLTGDPFEPSPAFEKWLRLGDLVSLSRTFSMGEAMLDDLLSKGNAVPTNATNAIKNTGKQTYIEALLRWTNWNELDLEFFLGKRDDSTITGSLGFAFPNDYRGEQILVRLERCFSQLARVGLSAAQANAIAQASITATDARSVKQAAKAKYSDAQWAKLARPLRDALREKQRAALVAYLVTTQRLISADELYGTYLLDVEMSPCMLTTRIKQAASSVQLFIQRCLLNLESVSPNVIDRDQWQWMKRYRLWEANRKVFLYPENWIEPELRDDKSPFFRDLENELLQGDVRDDSAEIALVHYLEKLSEVARLEMVGMCTQNEPAAGIDVLHAFGRTFSSPHIYYYRRRVDSSYWTSWEKINVDIQSDHLIPVVWNGRLFLFWAIFTEKPVKQCVPEPNTKGSDPLKRWEIYLEYSEYKNGVWTPKKASTDRLISPFAPTTALRNKHAYFLKNPPGTFSIRCYEPLETQSMVFLQKKDNIKDGGNNGGNNGGGTPPADTATLKVVVFHDVDRDRVRDSGEPGVSGVKIQVDPTLLGEETITGTTDSTGEYLFELEEGRSFYVSLLNAPVTYQHPLPPRQLITLLKNRANTVTFPLTTKPTVEDPCPPEQPDDAAIKSLMPAGDFSFIGCHLLRLIQGNGGPTLHPPTATHPVNMTFADDSAGNNAFVVNLNGNNVTILKQAPEVFRLASSHQELDFDPRSPFFYQDDHKNYFVSLAEYINPFEVLYAILTGQVSTFGPINLEQFKRKSLLFAPHFHAYVCNFLQDLSMSGVPALMNLQTQQRADSGSISIDGQAQAVPSGVNFWNRYQPNITLKFGDSSPVFPFALPKEVVEFGYAEAYASYNWELFFHAPLLIATRLSKNQRFEEAQRWFHYIFDPTDNSSLPSPARFWKTLPFFEAAKGSSIQELMTILANQNDHSETRNELVRQVDAWKKDPFNPHLIARFRTSAYQKSVVMKYLDNLIEWGDQLFRQDTIESINEATQLYILAAQILGRKPETMPLRNRPEVHTYNSLAPILDSFSNAIVQLENQTPSTSSSGSSGGQQGNGFSSVTTITTLYFCIPKNDKLLEYWDRTADRLFKIRHCMNIAGVVRELPLFEPPIDPGLLVRARAAGVDLSSALSDINAAPPLYRFQVMGQKAQEFCNDLKILGGALLSAIEKRDAEALALLRTSQESKILREVQQVREQQIVEARHAQEALERAKDATSSRQKYYSEREFINQWEGAQLALTTASTVLQVAAQVMQLTAAAVNNIPDFYTGGAGAMGSPLVFTFIAGGTKVSTGLNSAAQAMNILASVSTTLGSLSGAMGSYQRRADDWKFQADVAGKEIEQIERQILGAEVRGAIAEKELDTHKQQIENSKQVDEFMRGKFSNQDLYDWTIGQLSSIYFQSYQLAYDLAKRAEQAFRRELGVRDSSYIQFGYWDSLKKGLLAGERLSHDLKRMEAAYLDQNKREFEITKHVSLASLDPMALIALKEKKECFITLPEVLFDLDHPGQYMRRLKLVSVTVPCVTGPYTSVNCKLTLLKSSIRASSSAPGNYARGTNDTRFMDLFGAIESVVTSNAQNDSGLFEPNMRDERYLPFEGSGAISDWRIELPANFPQFDYDTISDVILHIRYTARDGGGTLKQKVVAELTTAVNAMTENLAGDGTTLFRSFSSRQEFSNQWYSFFNPTDAETSHKFNFNVSADRFPSMFRDKTIQLKAVHLFLKLKDGVSYQDSKQLLITLNKGTTTYPTKQFVLSGSPVSTLAYSTNAFQPQQTVGAWFLDVNRTAIPDWLRMKMPTGGDEIVKINSLDHYRLNSDLIDDVYMVWEYQIA